jgi:cytochrome c oxidase cbb3-type subunit 3
MPRMSTAMSLRVSLLKIAALVVTICFASSCKREERTFQTQPAAANIEDVPSLIPYRAGGATQRSAATRPAAPPGADYEANVYALSEGGRLFQAMNCTGCHAHGGGGIGPALMDDQWIYGWEPEVIFDSIVQGRPNGMPSFGGRMADYQVWQIVAYVRSLSGLTSRQAAPGRSDHMSGAPLPNSVQRERPRTSSLELEQLHHREQLQFARWGWMDSTSGEVRVPDSIVQHVAQQIARRGTTRPTTISANSP